MKNVKWFFPVLFSVFAIVSFPSCYDDYEIDPNENESNSFEDDNSSNNADELDEEYGISLYRVDGENIIQTEHTNASQNWMNDELKHNDMWDIVTNLIPTDRRQWIYTFEIFDGKQELLGYVVNTSEDLSQWKFGLDITSAYLDGQTLEKSGDFIYTVIHEYGHILSLNDQQLDAFANNCSNYNPGEGCAFENSYIDEFHERFWADIEEEANDIDEDDFDAIDDFYNKYSDRFVTDYAATNPAEDIAEVFSVFVTAENEPTGNQIKDQKIRFMYEYPELVDLRNHMRGTTYTIPAPGSWKAPQCHKAHSHKAKL